LIRAEAPGLLTITGGKWTTYRRMAEDCVTRAAALAGLSPRPCRTRELRIHGYRSDGVGDLAVYGTDADALRALIAEKPTLGERLHPLLPYSAAEVVWAARVEMARTVEDVLSRRTRALVLNAAVAIEMAPRVAELLARELGRDHRWRDAQVEAFTTLAHGYRA
jgi:glycerol-3-phosphate dehydrogenase